MNTIVLDHFIEGERAGECLSSNGTGAVGGAGGATHAAVNAIYGLRAECQCRGDACGLDAMGIESRPFVETDA